MNRRYPGFAPLIFVGAALFIAPSPARAAGTTKPASSAVQSSIQNFTATGSGTGFGAAVVCPPGTLAGEACYNLSGTLRGTPIGSATFNSTLNVNDNQIVHNGSGGECAPASGEMTVSVASSISLAISVGYAGDPPGGSGGSGSGTPDPPPGSGSGSSGGSHGSSGPCPGGGEAGGGGAGGGGGVGGHGGGGGSGGHEGDIVTAAPASSYIQLGYVGLFCDVGASPAAPSVGPVSFTGSFFVTHGSGGRFAALNGNSSPAGGGAGTGTLVLSGDKAEGNLLVSLTGLLEFSPPN